MDTNKEKKKTLEQEVTEIKAAVFDQHRAIQQIAQDTIKLRAELITMGERQWHSKIENLQTGAAKSRKDSDEMCSRLYALTESLGDLFSDFAGKLEERQIQIEEALEQKSGLKVA